MIYIGENIHIISKAVRQALENKDENFIKNLIKIQQNCDVIDLNIGPARGKLDTVFRWLVPLVEGKNISFDSSNIEAIKDGLRLMGDASGCFINSTSADLDRLEPLCNLALEYNCNLVALSMSKETGIPKTADERLELVLKIYEYCTEKGISPEKLFFDPLVLPVKIDGSQTVEALNTLKMIDESFEGGVNTVVGLSNVSNGALKEYRPLINRVYGVLAYGAGLKSVILDAKDTELFRIFKMLECNNPQSDVDNLYINLVNMVQCFGELEDVDFNHDNIEQNNIIKTVELLLNKKIYTDSFLQI